MAAAFSEMSAPTPAQVGCVILQIKWPPSTSAAQSDEGKKQVDKDLPHRARALSLSRRTSPSATVGYGRRSALPAAGGTTARELGHD